VSFKVPNQHRFTEGPFKTLPRDGNNGFFAIPFKRKMGKQGSMNYLMMCIVNDKHGWDRVSVYVIDKNGNVIPRTPLFEEMEAVKKYFWDDDDCVVQFHDVNHAKQQNPYLLHMWRPQKAIMMKPPIEALI